ncbi:MAG: 16S rRNA methyltransferase, partial [Gammaproteobacteria bacterium]|nr:16S rRNA methyltransferase [Gammaproteobacteria bacterium]
GFSTKEIDLIERYNWNIVSLGDRILRTETAAIVAQTILRDF